MIKIVKCDADGNVTSNMTVARGAYNEFFKPVGWHIEGEIVTSVKPEATQIIECKLIKGTVEDVVDDKPDDASDIEMNETTSTEPEVTDNSDLLEKPISNMSSAEIKKFAKLKGIGLAGCTSKSDAKAKVKEMLYK